MCNKECWLKDNCKQLHCNDKNGCLILYKLNYLYDEAGVSVKNRARRNLYTDADNTDVEEFKRLKGIQDNILDFVNSGKQLYIHSQQAGNGKTSWSLRLLQCYFNKIWLNTPLKCRGLFIHVPSFLSALKDDLTVHSDKMKELKNNICNCDLVIWDDIATKSSTVFEADTLLGILDTRINLGKANIFTSNLNDSEMHEALGDRLASRICNLSENIELHGGDKRNLAREENK